MGVPYFHIASIHILAVVGTLLPLSLDGQNGPESKEEVREKAEELFEEKRFVDAMPLYSQLLAHEPEDPIYNYRYGVCVLHGSADKEKPIKHLKYARNKQDVPPAAHYYLGRTYHLNYRFKDAIAAYEKFIEKGDPDELPAERGIEMCKNGLSLLKSPNEILVNKRTQTGTKEFFRYYDPQGVQGRILVAPDELMQEADKDRDERSIIFFPTGSNTIYYGSYGEDGERGKDIYRIERTPDGDWGEPKRLKSAVNTRYDEDYPFKPPDSEYLYFCSKGHNSMGGYDIFRAKYDSSLGHYGKAENLDFPINSPDDELLYLADREQEIAYFASGRSSDAEHLHVYEVSIQRVPMQTTVLKGRFKDRSDTTARKADILVMNARNNKRIGEFTSSSADGGYLISVPRSGTYRFIVQPAGSEESYEGKVEVPQLEEARPLKQRIFLEEEAGKKELVIENRFDERFENESEIMARVMKDKANLEENASDEMEQKLREAKDGKAGKEEGKSSEERKKELLSEAQEKAEKQKEAEEAYAEARDRAYSKARKEQEKAEKASVQADSLLTAARRSEDPEQKEELVKKARAAEKRTEEAQRKARRAYRMGEGFEAERSQREESAKKAGEYVAALEKASESGRTAEEMRQASSEERSEMETSLQGEKSRPPVKALKKETQALQEQSEKELESGKRKRQQVEELEDRIRRHERRIEASSGDEQEELRVEKRELEREKTRLKAEADSAYQRAQALQSKADRKAEGAELMEAAGEDGESRTAQEMEWSGERKKSLKEAIEQSSEKQQEISSDPLLAQDRGGQRKRMQEESEGNSRRGEDRNQRSEGGKDEGSNEKSERTQREATRGESGTSGRPGESEGQVPYGSRSSERIQQERERDIEAIRAEVRDPERREDLIQERRQRELERIDEAIRKQKRIRRESENERERAKASERIERLEELRTEIPAREESGGPGAAQGDEKGGSITEEERTGDGRTEQERRERARSVVEANVEKQEGGASETERARLARRKAREALTEARERRRKARRIRDSLRRERPAEGDPSESAREKRFRALMLEREADSTQGMAEAFQRIADEGEEESPERIASTQEDPSGSGSESGSSGSPGSEEPGTASSEESETKDQGEGSDSEGTTRSIESDPDEEGANTDESSESGSESEAGEQTTEEGGSERDANVSSSEDEEEGREQNTPQTLSRSILFMESPSSIEESEANFFAETENSPYSSENPIPKDPEMPDGTIYQVQVGAFRNAIPQDHFQGFAPLIGKTGDDGITRYRAGFFKQRSSAEEARDRIREMGYTDAFVVAYEGGERTSLSAASSGGSPGQEGDRTDELESSEPVGEMEGLFFTVQVGVYSDPVREEGPLEGIGPLYVKRTANGHHRYSTGVFSSVEAARGTAEEVRVEGIEDAFITAYRDGERIRIDRAEQLLAQQGSDILYESSGDAPQTMQATEPEGGEEASSPDPEEIELRVDLGTYGESVPNQVAEVILSSSGEGVKKRETEDGRSNYRTKSYRNLEEANESQRKFVNKGIEEAEVIALVNGEKIPLEKASRILEER